MIPGIPGFGGFEDLIQKAQDLQRRMEESQAALRQQEVEGTAGGGMVKVRASGALEIRAVRIEKEVVDPSRIEMLEDLVAAATNQALERARRIHKDALSQLTGGIDIPGMFPSA